MNFLTISTLKMLICWKWQLTSSIMIIWHCFVSANSFFMRSYIRPGVAIITWTVNWYILIKYDRKKWHIDAYGKMVVHQNGKTNYQHFHLKLFIGVMPFTLTKGLRRWYKLLLFVPLPNTYAAHVSYSTYVPQWSFCI